MIPEPDGTAREAANPNNLAIVLEALGSLDASFVSGAQPEEDDAVARAFDRHLAGSPPGVPLFLYGGVPVELPILVADFSMGTLRDLSADALRQGLPDLHPVVALAGGAPEEVRLRLDTARLHPRLAGQLVETAAEHLADKALERIFAILGPVASSGPRMTFVLPLRQGPPGSTEFMAAMSVASQLVLVTP